MLVSLMYMVWIYEINARLMLRKLITYNKQKNKTTSSENKMKRKKNKNNNNLKTKINETKTKNYKKTNIEILFQGFERSINQARQV